MLVLRCDRSVIGYMIILFKRLCNNVKSEFQKYVSNKKWANSKFIPTQTPIQLLWMFINQQGLKLNGPRNTMVTICCISFKCPLQNLEDWGDDSKALSPGCSCRGLQLCFQYPCGGSQLLCPGHEPLRDHQEFEFKCKSKESLLQAQVWALHCVHSDTAVELGRALSSAMAGF